MIVFATEYKKDFYDKEFLTHLKKMSVTNLCISKTTFLLKKKGGFILDCCATLNFKLRKIWLSSSNNNNVRLNVQFHI